MSGDKLRKRSFVITKDRARSIRPVLNWIKEDAPRKSERVLATKLLEHIEGVRDIKQILLSKGEAELFMFVMTEFPTVGDTEKQLSMFDLHKIGRPEVVVLPYTPNFRSKPTLKQELTKEEQNSRAAMGLPRLGSNQKSKE